nr:uncharacterized protein LOC109174869 [Ipomoea batatas]
MSELGIDSTINMDPKSGVIVTKEREWMTRIENPFTLKVGQVFTGFGIGCGVGIGVGRPLNLGAIPMVSQVMVATRGATDAFSGVGRHVNNYLRHLGVKNIEAGIGCGIGFGHGFGIGLAVKPGVVHQIQSSLAQLAAKAMTKLGMAPNLSVGQGIAPKSIQTGMGVVNETSTLNPLGNVMPVQPKVLENFMPKDGNSSFFSSNETSDLEKNPLSTSYSSRTENVISNFLQTPLFKGGENEANELVCELNRFVFLNMVHESLVAIVKY